jgi:hypothetical protein
MIFEVVAQDFSCQSVQGAASGGERAHDFFAAALFSESALDGLNLPSHPTDPGY